jgi:PKD repeat protein
MAYSLELVGSLATPEVIEAAVLSTAANAATAEAAVALIEPGVPGGIATLDEDGAIPESQVPARLSVGSVEPAGLSTATLASLSNTIGSTVATLARPKANTVVIIGPSLEEQIGQGSETIDPAFITGQPLTSSMRARGWFHWANGFLGNQLDLVINSGVGGNRYDQMLARFDADVMAYPSDWVFIGSPTNDVTFGRSSTQIIADLEAMLDKCAADGRRVVIHNIPPRGSFVTTALRLVVAEVNRYIADLAFTRAGVIPVDINTPLADPNTGYPAIGTTVDGTHYSIPGAALLGAATADALRGVFANRPALVSGSADPRRIISNPAFTGGGTGWVALSGTSLSFASKGFSAKAVAAIAGNTAITSLRGMSFTEHVAGGLFQPGDVVQVTARIKWTDLVALGGNTPAAPVLRLEQMDSGGAVVKTANALHAATSEWVTYPNDDLTPKPTPKSGEMVLTTWKTVIQPTTDRVRLLIGWIGAASVTMEVSEVAPLKDKVSTELHPSPGPANVGPVAAITSSSVGLTLTASGSGSTDSDGSIASYAWTFGDGGAATGVSPSHTYAAAGSYTVALTVTDNTGATNTATASVTVAAPIVRPSAGVAGYSNRWTAAELSGTDGTAVSAWSDTETSVALAQATAGLQPTIQTVNGVKVVRFDGVDDYLAKTALTAWNSIVIIGRMAADADTTIVNGLFQAGSGGDVGVTRGVSGLRPGVFWTGSRIATAPTTMPLTNGLGVVLQMRNTNGDARFQYNDIAIGDATVEALETVTTLDIGRRTTTYGKLEVVEVLLFPFGLTDAQMANIRSAALTNYPALFA